MSDVWDWGKGAVEDIWGATSGQAKYQPKAYDAATVAGAQSPWLQDLKSASGHLGEQPFQSRLSQDAAELRTGQQPTYDAMGNLIGDFNPEAAATRVEGVADAYGQDVARQAAGIESLASEVAGAPSYADEASRAAMDRAASEASARAASTRGANAALQMREAAGATAGAARQAASEAGALKAQEMNQRFQTRGGLLASAAGVAGQGAATQGNLYGAAGDQRRMGMQAGVDAHGTIASQKRDDVATRGNLTAQAGQLGLEGQSLRQDATAAGLSGATQGQQIAAGSHDNAVNAQAGISSGNAARKQQTIGGLMQGAGAAIMASDVRSKEDIVPLPLDGSDPEKQGLDLSSLAKAAPMILSAVSDERAKTEVQPLVMMAVDPDANREALAPAKPYGYRYKADIAQAIGADTEPRAGIMAQDLEKSAAGDAVVSDGPGLKTLDRDRALGYALAGTAGLDKRLRLLEQAVKGG